MMKKTIRFLDDHLELLFISFAVVAISVLMLVQVILRYCFSDSLSWVEETVVYLNVWIGFIGMSYSMKYGTDMRMDFVDMLPPLPRKIFRHLAELVFLFFYIYMAKIGFSVVGSMIVRVQRSSAARIPLYVVYASLMVGSLMAIFRYIQKVWRRSAANAASGRGQA